MRGFQVLFKRILQREHSRVDKGWSKAFIIRCFFLANPPKSRYRFQTRQVFGFVVAISSLELKCFFFYCTDFAQKRVLKLVEWFSGHCRAIKS